MQPLEDKLIESSRPLIDILVLEIADNQILFDEVMELVYRDQPPVSMRAAWLASHILEGNVHLIFPHVEKISKFLSTTKIDATKRGFMYVMSKKEVELTEDQLGIFADLAFQWAESPREAIAVRACSIEFLLRVLYSYPEIKPELIALLESMIPEGSAGIKNKCSRLIKNLNKRQ